MKKKIYFIVSSVLQILFTIFIILNVHEIVNIQLKSIKETYAMFPVDFQERMLGMLQNSGPKFIIFTSIIAVIINLITIIIAYKNNILRKKGLLIAFSVISFFCAENIFVQLLAIVNFIVLLCIKRTKPEDYPNGELVGGGVIIKAGDNV